MTQLAPGALQAALDGLQRIAAGGHPDPVAELRSVVNSLPHAQQAPPTNAPPGVAPPGATPGAPAPPVDPASGSAVSMAKGFLGTPYVWGGESPNGFDCSGLLQYVWGKKGIQIPRTTYDQFKTGAQVSEKDLQPGDAVFFTGSDPMNGLPGHVGMYIGSGQFIEAPHTGATVRISTLAGRSDFVGARRYG